MLVEQTSKMPTGDAMQAMVMANLRQEVGHIAKYIEVAVERANGNPRWSG